MKLLYITNAINGSGGLERVLSVKASYLADNMDYEVHVLTLNNGHKNPFYDFSDKIKLHDIKVGGNPINYILQYKKGIQNIINTIQPEVISVCDDGLKGMLFPLIFGKKIPVIYERHVSKQIETRTDLVSPIHCFKIKLKFALMNFAGSKFHKFVVLTNGNLKEWELNNVEVIPNSLPFNNGEQSTLINKKILVVGKQSYQKGYDRLLDIWSLVHEKFPDWRLEVYGKLNPKFGLEAKAEALAISKSVHFYPPVKDIQKKYKEAAIYVMTSRFEGFGMVLIEAMSFGVPCVSFDCPHGPADIIENKEDGFLVEEGNIDNFVAALNLLIENNELRKKMGQVARKNAKQYAPEIIMPLWDHLFKSLIKKVK